MSSRPGLACGWTAAATVLRHLVWPPRRRGLQERPESSWTSVGPSFRIRHLRWVCACGRALLRNLPSPLLYLRVSSVSSFSSPSGGTAAKMQIFVKTLTGKTITLEVRARPGRSRGLKEGGPEADLGTRAAFRGTTRLWAAFLKSDLEVSVVCWAAA